MLTISCYTFHPIIQKFVRLYKYVQVISAWLTFLLSCLCCQCLESVPMSNTSSDWALLSPVNTTGNCGEPITAPNLVEDLTSLNKNSDITKEKCAKYWEILKDQPELEGVLVFPNRKPEAMSKELSEVLVHKKAFKYKAITK